MVQNKSSAKSPDTSVASDLAAMMVSTSSPSPGGSSVAQPSLAASGESSCTFLSTLDAVATGGFQK